MVEEAAGTVLGGGAETTKDFRFVGSGDASY
jgi:hypothetical protein